MKQVEREMVIRSHFMRSKLEIIDEGDFVSVVYYELQQPVTESTDGLWVQPEFPVDYG